MTISPADVLGIVVADLRHSALGLPSLLSATIDTGTVLSHTVGRLQAVKGISRAVLSVPAEQAESARLLLAGVSTAIIIEPRMIPDPSWRPAIRRARKWSLRSWSGGLGRSTVFDEYDHPAEWARLAKQYQANWLAIIPAEAPLFDPALMDALISRAQEAERPPPLVYGTIPPGLSGWVERTDFVAELAARNLHAGFVLGYRAWEPTIELIDQPFALRAALPIACLEERLLADCPAHLDRLRQLRATSAWESSATLATTMSAWSAETIPEVPEELEIEITTQRSVPVKYLPTAHRPNMTLATWERVVHNFAAANPAGLLVLGGHGDPLIHPELSTFLDGARNAGLFGLAILTDGIALSQARGAELCLAGVDVVQVRLDANSREVYRLLHGDDRFAEVVENIQTLIQTRERLGASGPRVVVSMVRCRATIAHLEAFYDRWTTHADAAMIVPWSDDIPGPAPEVLPIEPPARSACRRLHRRMMLLADGNVVTCSEDAQGVQGVGSIAAENGPWAIWRDGLARCRADHAAQHWDAWPICGSCRQWHRP